MTEIETALERLCVAAKGRDNLEPYIEQAYAAGASAEDVQGVLRRVYGAATPPEVLALAAQHGGELQ
jgi:hypothetical protein